MEWLIIIFAGAMVVSLTTFAIVMIHTTRQHEISDEVSSISCLRNKKKSSEKRPALDPVRRMPFIREK